MRFDKIYKLKGVMKMENRTQVTDNDQVELSHEKQSYEAPRLKKLGTVKELTLGGTVVSWDDHALFTS